MVKINNKALGTFGITSILSFKYNLGSYETVGSSWNVGAIKAVRGQMCIRDRLNCIRSMLIL